MYVLILSGGGGRTKADLALFSDAAQAGGSGAGLAPLVEFYSKLTKGPAPASAVKGIKARYFAGDNASAAPLLYTIFGIFGLGYTIDYHSTSKNFAVHIYFAGLSQSMLSSAPKYVGPFVSLHYHVVDPV